MVHALKEFFGIPTRGLLKWRDVIRAVAHMKTHGILDLSGASVVEIANGLKVSPSSAREAVRPLWVGIDGDNAYVTPGWVMAGAGWMVPILNLQSLLEANQFVGTPEFVWLRLTIGAYIAPSVYGVEDPPSVFTAADTWTWSGCRLLDAVIIGDGEGDRFNEPGEIQEHESGDNISATMTSPAVNWILLAQLVDGAYENLGSGNMKVTTTRAQPAGTLVKSFEPFVE